MSEQNKQTVADKVREYLNGARLNGVTFEVNESGIREEEHWWYVPIRPSAWPPKMFEFYEALAEIEEELEEREHLKVLLASGEPQPSPVA
jgi:hypothetical protein